MNSSGFYTGCLGAWRDLRPSKNSARFILRWTQPTDSLLHSAFCLQARLEDLCKLITVSALAYKICCSAVDDGKCFHQARKLSSSQQMGEEIISLDGIRTEHFGRSERENSARAVRHNTLERTKSITQNILNEQPCALAKH